LRENNHAITITRVSDTEHDLPEDIEALKRMVLEHRALLDSRTREIESLKLLIAKLRRMQFGRSSERLSREIEQLEFALDELQTETPIGSSVSVSLTAEQPTPRRRALPEHLARERVVHEPACSCPQCGADMRAIGEDVSEVLDYLPGRFRVIRHVRPKLACVKCDCIAQAPAPSRPIERGLPGAGLLAHVLVSKYADHLPLYRQSEIYAREGVELERSTMAEWVGKSFALLEPLVAAPGATSWRPRSCTPTTRRSRCSTRDAARPRPGGCGPMSGTIAPPGARILRRCCSATPRIGAGNGLVNT